MQHIAPLQAGQSHTATAVASRTKPRIIMTTCSATDLHAQHRENTHPALGSQKRCTTWSAAAPSPSTYTVTPTPPLPAVLTPSCST